MSTSRTESLAIAHRYASAMFELAVQAGSEAALVADLRRVANAVAAHADLAAALANPLLARDVKASILAALPKGADALTLQSLRTLVLQGRVALLGQVTELLEAKLSAHRGELVAEITSAHPLAEAVVAQLKASIAKATGKPVTLKLQQNPALLGGVSVQIGSHLLDASLAGALNTMRTQWRNAYSS